MEIVKTKDPNVIKVIKNNIQKYINDNEVTDYDFQSVVRWLRNAANSPFNVIFVAMNDDGNESVGHCIANIVQTLNGERFDILQIIGNTEEVEAELIHFLEKYALEYSVPMISIMTKYPKKFKEIGFELTAHDWR